MQQIKKTIAEFIGDDDTPAVGPDDSVATAVAAMKAHKSNYVVVLDNEQLVGIFTERDFLNRVTAARREPAAIQVRDVMTSELQTLSSTDCISYAINRMAVGGFRNVPIVDPDGKFRVVLTVRDVIGHLSELLSEYQTDGEAADMQEWMDTGGG